MGLTLWGAMDKKVLTENSTYPNEFVSYPRWFSWSGIVPTTTTNGSAVCATVAGTSTTEFFSFCPPLTIPTAAAPTGPGSIGVDDASSLNYQPLWDNYFGPQDAPPEGPYPAAATMCDDIKTSSFVFRYATAYFEFKTMVLDP